jgi:hypothetical protein
MLFVFKLVASVLEWLIGLKFAMLDGYDRFLDRTLRLPLIEIHLTEVLAAVDAPPAAVRDCEAALAACGFVAAGVYDVAEMPGVRIYGWVQTEAAVRASAWMQEGRLLLDLLTEYAGGGSFTITNHEDGRDLPRDPEHPCLRMPGAAPGELYSRLLAERGEQPVRPVSSGDYAVRVQKFYRDQQEWLSARGGYTLDEIRTLVGRRTNKTDESLLVEFRRRIAFHALRNWYRLQLAPPIPWELVEDNLLIIHDDMTLDEALELFDRWSSGLDEPKNARHMTPRQIFASLEGHPDACIERFWVKTSPLAADFYCPRGLLAALEEQDAGEEWNQEPPRQAVGE